MTIISIIPQPKSPFIPLLHIFPIIINILLGIFYEKQYYIKQRNMKVISTKTHGILDYVMGILLIASPWIFGFADNDTAKWIPIILGVGSLLYSLMTDYEMGMSKTISMKTHLTLDTMAGIFLAASPWIFGFSDDVYLPHLILGLLEVGAAMMTKSTTASSYKNANHSHAI